MVRKRPILPIELSRQSAKLLTLPIPAFCFSRETRASRGRIGHYKSTKMEHVERTDLARSLGELQFSWKSFRVRQFFSSMFAWKTLYTSAMFNACLRLLENQVCWVQICTLFSLKKWHADKENLAVLEILG